MIRFEQVTKHYSKGGNSIRALDGITFDVPQGALALVAGPSGSGKTTMINLAAGLSGPTRGAVTVAGERLDRLGQRARTALRARKIAVVFQMFHLVPYLSAFENVLLPTLAAPQDHAVARARQLLEDVGLAHRAEHLPRELSAGERQRCALARALLNRPQVILADEPTGNLDDQSAQLVLDALARSRAQGATVLLASHQHFDAIRPDLAFHLREGKLVQAPNTVENPR